MSDSATLLDADVIDLFAGAGGWDHALRVLLRYPGRVVGIDNYADAVATARAAGHVRIERDVRDLVPPPAAAGSRCLVGGPPCQGWSKAGNSPGRPDRVATIALIDRYAAGMGPALFDWRDPRSRLTAEPMRWIAAMRPQWVALEQVPDVITLWEVMAERLEPMGYRCWTGILAADRYGVAQTRRRSFLLASLDLQPTAPAPTVQRAVTIREALELAADDPRVMRSNYAGSTAGGRRTAEERGRTMRTLDQPSVTITGRPPQWETGGDPASRIRLSSAECSALQSFPADHPWQGLKMSRHQQIGNAVPPLLAAAVLRQFVGGL